MFYMNDPDDIREVMNKNEKIHGHEEMWGWWDLLVQYRHLIKGKKFEVFTSQEIGLMDDHDIENPKRTKVAKLARKRVLELLSKKQNEPLWVSK